MISVARIGRGLVKYLDDQTRPNYFFDGGEPPGRWLGSARRRLQVSGTVRRQDLHALTLGFDLGGDKLVQNAGKMEGQRPRHLGISLVFNASKSWTLRWALSDHETQKQLQDAFERAVHRTVREYIEPEIARCRLRDGTEVAAHIVAALFIHVTNRLNEVHYHGHAVIPSLGKCLDGKIRALVSKHFYNHKLDMGAYFRVALEHECRQLGLTFYRPLDAKGERKPYTETEGPSAEMCRHFAKRRSQIEERLGDKGLASSRASDVAALQTRQQKPIVPPRAELLAACRNEAIANGFSVDWATRVGHNVGSIDHPQAYARALRTAVDICTRKEGHFQRKDIFREMLVAAQGRGGIDPFTLCTYLNDDLQRSPAIVNLGIRNAVQRFTTPEMLSIEKEMLSDVDHLRAAKFKPLSDKHVHRAVEKKHRVNPSQATTPIGTLRDAIFGDKQTHSLKPDAKACVRYVTQDPGRIKIICGPAGSTKSSVARAIAEAFHKSGWKTYGTAVSGIAAKNFAEKTGVQSDTLRMTLMRLCPSTADFAKHHAKQLVRAARGMPTYNFDRLALDRRSAMFVDEASMVSTRDMALLTKACRSSGALLILIGDRKQLPAIDPGGAFGAMIDRIGRYELSEVERQTSEKERDRVKKLYGGEVEAVLKSYAQDGHLHVARTGAKAQQELIRRWAHNGGLDAPSEHVIFAPTNIEVRRLNDMAQLERRNAGKVGRFRSITIADETFFHNDRVLFTHKSRKLGLENGDVGTIVGIRNNPLSAAVRVRLDREKRVREIPIRTLLQTHYDGLTRFYATTVHKMQGRTVGCQSYCLLSGKMSDRELTYVALSRHKDSVHIFTDENHAGVALTNVARKAAGDGQPIRARPGVKKEYSPLIKQASESHEKTLASDHRSNAAITLTQPSEPTP